MITVPPDDEEKNVEPALVERELTQQDYQAIRRALQTGRGLGWVHSVGLARRALELEAEVARLRRELYGEEDVSRNGDAD